MIPHSRGKTYVEQQKLVSQAPFYRVPKILEAATCIFMEYVHTGSRSYMANDNSLTYTHCHEKYNKDWQLVVGGFSGGGLYVRSDFGIVFGFDYVGVGGLRQFS